MRYAAALLFAIATLTACGNRAEQTCQHYATARTYVPVKHGDQTVMVRQVHRWCDQWAPAPTMGR